MAQIQYDSELMTNYVSAVPAPAGSQFFTILDPVTSRPIVFALSNENPPRLQATKAGLNLSRSDPQLTSHRKIKMANARLLTWESSLVSQMLLESKHLRLDNWMIKASFSVSQLVSTMPPRGFLFAGLSRFLLPLKSTFCRRKIFLRFLRSSL
jgi:hypothetical protein